MGMYETKLLPTFSVIIPVYNVEKYLNRCIDSVLKQTYKDYEIILVDDGSTDESASICDEYSAKYSNIKTIHQKNKGVSAARNTGISTAKGKYICFIDSDDFIDDHYLEKFSESDADLVICGFYDYAQGKIVKTIPNINSQYLLNGDEDFLKTLNGTGSVFVWGKRLKKAIITNNSIKFDEKMKFSEDIIFNNEYLLKSKSVQTINYQGYFHCQYFEYKTLSGKAKEYSFPQRNHFREIAFNQFKGHKEIQDIYVNQTLYFAELEFVKIAGSKKKIGNKISSIRSILNDNYFNVCLSLNRGSLSISTTFFCRHKMALALILKYKRTK